MHVTLDDTIVAIATPPGRGGVGIVRLSGPQAWPIGQRIFRRRADRVPRPNRLYFGHAIDPATRATLDEGLIAFMRGPRSYTGDDMAEINAHGSPVALGRIVAAALASGARSAEPGEMTLRAFVHGRIDLAQAEAVADLIAANSDAAARQALDVLSGQLSQPVRAARAEILRALAPIDASIDFPEEEVPQPERAAIGLAIDTATATVRDLLAGAERGRVAREGVRCAIVGRPNAGKSSLLNALLRADRAIVTPVAGTTRDTIEETAIVGGVACHLVDTAGIAATDDPIERLGVERSRDALARADLALWVIDRSALLDEADREVLAAIASEEGDRRDLIAILNKSDLPHALAPEEVVAALAAAGLPAIPPERIVATSLVTGEGLGELERAIAATALGAPAGESAGLVARVRHRDALRRAGDALALARQSLAGGVPLDFVAEDLRDALGALGNLLGEAITEDLLSSIFSEFCIGK